MILVVGLMRAGPDSSKQHNGTTKTHLCNGTTCLSLQFSLKHRPLFNSSIHPSREYAQFNTDTNTKRDKTKYSSCILNKLCLKENYSRTTFTNNAQRKVGQLWEHAAFRVNRTLCGEDMALGSFSKASWVICHPNVSFIIHIKPYSAALRHNHCISEWDMELKCMVYLWSLLKHWLAKVALF